MIPNPFSNPDLSSLILKDEKKKRKRGSRPVCHESQAGIISSPYDKKIVPLTQLFIAVIGMLASKVVIRKLHSGVI